MIARTRTRLERLREIEEIVAYACAPTGDRWHQAINAITLTEESIKLGLDGRVIDDMMAHALLCAWGAVSEVTP